MHSLVSNKNNLNDWIKPAIILITSHYSSRLDWCFMNLDLSNGNSKGRECEITSLN